jgi:pseudouridine-5'-phosphate glycosidase
MDALRFSGAALAAKANNIELVALESTLISHGLPYPDNVTVALAAEEAVRIAGSVPATIAVLDSEARIGLEREELERLATAKSVLKLSRRNLPVALAGNINSAELGATTVSATIILAQRAGIKLFATGGIGGVHRGVAESMDISADLFELGHTSVAVVCSGPKVILDLPRTREYLETIGVTVIGYGCDEMPAFWARSSGIAS